MVLISKCIICFSGIDANAIIALTKCGHTFHEKCVNQWLKQTKVCPTCRAKTMVKDVLKLYFDPISMDDTLNFTQGNNDELVNQLNTHIEKLKDEKKELLKQNEEKENKVKNQKRKITDLERKVVNFDGLKLINKQLEGRLIDQSELCASLKRTEDKLRASEFYELIKAGSTDQWNKFIDNEGILRIEGFERLFRGQYKVLKEKYGRLQSEVQRLNNELNESKDKNSKQKKLILDLQKDVKKATDRLNIYDDPLTPSNAMKKVFNSEEYKRKSLGFNFDDDSSLIFDGPSNDNFKTYGKNVLSKKTDIGKPPPKKKEKYDLFTTNDENVTKKSKAFTFFDDDEDDDGTRNKENNDSIIIRKPLFGNKKIQPFATDLNDKLSHHFTKPSSIGITKVSNNGDNMSMKLLNSNKTMVKNIFNNTGKQSYSGIKKSSENSSKPSSSIKLTTNINGGRKTKTGKQTTINIFSSSTDDTDNSVIILS